MHVLLFNSIDLIEGGQFATSPLFRPSASDNQHQLHLEAMDMPVWQGVVDSWNRRIRAAAEGPHEGGRAILLSGERKVILCLSIRRLAS